ncbi:MAG TPA: LLM class flavin-dependent oxidoreductase [Stellaceae bacterium]|nr:LLM class flavin-dependent oxidoreductase [Stellaceae bacterium]
MEFGMFHEFRCTTNGATHAETFASAFAEIDAAEEMGLDVIWLGELHMDPTRSVLSAPLTVASAVGMRTRRIKIGIAVQVLPLVHPMRIAEEAATVDQISQGRLVFGVGRSGLPRGYDAYGIPYAESHDRFPEALALIKRAWTENSFSYEGRFYSCKNVNLSPKPYQRPHPPIRVAASSPDTFPTIGRLGDAIMVAVRAGSLSDLVPSIKAYREAWREAGHPGRGAVYLRIPVYIAETERLAREEPEASIMNFYRLLGERIVASAGQAGVRTIERRAERGQDLQALTYDAALRTKLVIGTPDRVVDRLRQIEEELGLDGILAECNCGGGLPPARVMNSLRLLCEQVLPQFR